MILLALAQSAAILKKNPNINNRRTAIAFIPLSSPFPRGETLCLFLLIIILELNLNPEIILRQLQNMS